MGTEFYIGYEAHAPKSLARWARRCAAGLLLLAAVASLALVFGQGRFAPSVFEFGAARTYEGIAIARPYPALRIATTGPAGTLPSFESYALVAEGKHGADALVAGLDGKPVRLKGTLIHRAGTRMLEVVAGSVQPLPAAAIVPGDEERLGEVALVGEIVDSKCYLGVMNPGSTKPHRECASLCIRGGVPPLFVARDAAGREAHLWLVSEAGAPVNQAVLEYVAEPIEIRGRVSRREDRLFLQADSKSYRRLSP